MDDPELSDGCLSPDLVRALFARRLPESTALGAERHLASCALCRELAALVARVEPSDAAASTVEAPVPVVDGRFVLGPLVAAGGMGVVHRGRDAITGRAVAIEILYPVAGVDFRFDREWEALSGLRHPGIVEYVAHGTTPLGQRYIVTEWLDGETLADTLERETRLAPEAACALVRRAAEAVAAAHRRGIIHRDLKPENLFLVDGDPARIKVLDFGLARRWDSEDRRTATGVAVGTPGYMSPEQARGNREIDTRSDVFALGCLLYRCATGRPPFVGATVLSSLLRTILASPPVAVDGIPDGLAAILAALLAKDPRARPADAGEVARRLAGLEALEAPAGATTAPTSLDLERRGASVALVRPSSASTYEARIRALADRHRGHVDRLTDGTLAVTFVTSAPAQDRALAAARFALEVFAVDSTARVAVASGRVLAGEQADATEVLETAARLFEEAAPGTPRLDRATADRAGSRIEVAVVDDGGIALRGERDPTLVGPGTLGSEIVGRGREIAALDALREEAITERTPRVALITAHPGVGKSRLLAEVAARSRSCSEAPVVLIASGDPTRQAVPLGIVADTLRRAAGVLPTDRTAETLEKLRAWVPSAAHDDARLDQLASLAAIAGVEPQSDAALALDPSGRGAALRAAFVEQILALSTERPLVWIIDDAQWADVPSVEVVRRFVARALGRPVLLVVAGRPETSERFPELVAFEPLSHIRLPSLPASATAELVRRALGPVPDDVCAAVHDKSQGNALCIEHLARAMAEGNSDELPGAVALLLQARIESLDPALRRVLRAASVLGDEFEAGAVDAVLAESGGGSRTAGHLDELERRDLVAARGTGVAAKRYAFSHALLRDAAYAMLPESDRRQCHLRAADWLEGSRAAEPTTIAAHRDHGGDSRGAARWWQLAAEQALDAGDLAGAQEHAERGARWSTVPEEAGRSWLVIARVQGLRGQARERQRSAGEAVVRLRSGNAPWCAALGEHAIACGLLGQSDGLRSSIDQMLAAEVPPEARAAQICALAAPVALCFHAGDVGFGDRILSWMEREAAALPAEDILVTARLHQASAPRWFRSAPARALRHRAAAAEAFARAGDLRNACQQRVNLAHAQTELGLWPEADAMLRAALAEAEAWDLAVVRAACHHNLGFVLLRTGAPAEAERHELLAIAAFAANGERRGQGISRGYLAQILLASGDLSAAQREARQSIAELDEFPASRAVALATAAQIARRRGRIAEAVALATDAALHVNTSLEEGEVYIRLALAEALRAAGRVAEARRVLAAAHARIAERASTIDDEAIARRYVADVPENARVAELAALWAGG